jgi:hypothetical protein
MGLRIGPVERPKDARRGTFGKPAGQTDAEEGRSLWKRHSWLSALHYRSPNVGQHIGA